MNKSLPNWLAFCHHSESETIVNSIHLIWWWLLEELVWNMWQQCKTTETVRLNWCRSCCNVVISLISASGGKAMKRRPSISQYSEEYQSDGEPTARKEYASPPPPYRSDIISGSVIAASSCWTNTKLLFCMVIFFIDQTILSKYELVVSH